MKTKISSLVSIIAFALFSSCATPPGGTSFANSPAGQAVIKTAVSAIMVGAMSAGVQYASTGHVNGQQIVNAELPVLYGSQQSMYALMGTPQVNSSSAIVAAVTQGGGNSVAAQLVAPITADNVKAMINQGIAADRAVQKAADALGATPKVAVAVQKGALAQTTVANAAKTVAAAP